MTSESQLNSVDEACCEAFEAAWMHGERLDIADCLPQPDDVAFLPTLEELVCIQMELQWKANVHARELTTVAGLTDTRWATRPLRVEDYCTRFPQLDEEDRILRLIRQEQLIRRRNSDSIDVHEYRRRFPGIPPQKLPDEDQVATSDGLYESSVAGGSSESVPEIEGYDILEVIGRGGMGVVYKARQLDADRLVALKLIRMDRLKSSSADQREEVLERFRTEAQATAKLEQENVVAIYHVDSSKSDQPWFAMQYVEGVTLSDRLTGGPLTSRECAEYSRQISSAVRAAHQKGILHRDLKPQNVFVRNEDGRLLVGDFGLAKLAQDDSQRTSADTILGTPAYMSPEQIHDASGVDVRADIWSLGAILYQMLVGRPPFQAASVMETLRQVTDHVVVAPRSLNPQIDRDINTICLKCLEKDASQRYQSADELRSDLQRYLEGRPILARPISSTEQVFRWCRRNPLPATLVVLMIVSLLTATVAMWVGYRTATQALQESDDSHELARATVNDLLTEVSDTMLFDQPGLQPLRQRLQQKALGYYRRFVTSGRGTPEVRYEMGVVWQRIAQIEQELGHPSEAETAFNASIRQLRELEQTSSNPEIRTALSNSLNAFGGFRISQQRWDDAESFLNQALSLRDELIRESPEDLNLHRLRANTVMNLGAVARNLGQFAKAEKCFLQAEETHGRMLSGRLNDERLRTLLTRDRAKAFYNLANTSIDSGEAETRAEFEVWLREATRLFDKLCQDHPESYGDRRRLILCLQLKAETASEVRTAVRHCQSAIDSIEDLIQRNPAVPQLRREWKQLQLLLSRLLTEAENFSAAIESLDEAGRHQDVPVSAIDAIIIAEAALLAAELGLADAEGRLATAHRQLRGCTANSAGDREVAELLMLVEQHRRALTK